MISSSLASSARPANVLARLVMDDMPGMGVDWITKGAKLATDRPFTLVVDAIAAARELSGDNAPAVGVFQAKGGYELFQLETSRPSSPTPRSWDMDGVESYVARTGAGRSLITIVDGDFDASIMSASSFRKYERYAGGEW